MFIGLVQALEAVMYYQGEIFNLDNPSRIFASSLGFRLTEKRNVLVNLRMIRDHNKHVALCPAQWGKGHINSRFGAARWLPKLTITAGQLHNFH